MLRLGLFCQKKFCFGVDIATKDDLDILLKRCVFGGVRAVFLNFFKRGALAGYKFVVGRCLVCGAGVWGVLFYSMHFRAFNPSHYRAGACFEYSYMGYESNICRKMFDHRGGDPYNEYGYDAPGRRIKVVRQQGELD